MFKITLSSTYKHNLTSSRTTALPKCLLLLGFNLHYCFQHLPGQASQFSDQQQKQATINIWLDISDTLLHSSI